jgi:hypothetical protein
LPCTGFHPSGRRSEALRLSLSDAFSGHADQQGQQQKQQQAGASSSKPVLSEQARNALLEQCLKLATENKITDGNAWHLDLIQHLPDIVSSGPGRGQGSSGGYNFQKMSGGLDAGARTAAASPKAPGAGALHAAPSVCCHAAKDPSAAAQGHGWQTGCNKGLQQSHAQLAHNAS